MVTDAGMANGILWYFCSTLFAETLIFLKHLSTEKIDKAIYKAEAIT